MVCTVVRAQDPIYSQFYAAPLQLNPAFAGNTFAPSIALNYRNQWPNFPNAYTTYSASFDQYLEAAHSGVGFMVQSDNAGEGLLKTTSLSGFYAYRLELTNSLFLKGGIELGAVQTRFDWDRFVFLDQLDQIDGNVLTSDEERPDNTTNTYFDVSTGILLFSERFYGGLTMKHLNTPDESIISVNSNLRQGLPMRLSLHGGMQIPIWEGNNAALPAFISPNLLYIKQGNFQQVNAGAQFGLGVVQLGTWFRHTFGNSDAVILAFGLQKGVIKVGYSFDWTVSSFGIATGGGSHELSLRLNFDNTDERRRRNAANRYNDCFNIFR
jgi:type IX secretion system PorP/SprF family membrane protein